MTLTIEPPIDPLQAFAFSQIPLGFTFQALHRYQDEAGKDVFWRLRAKNLVTNEKFIRPIRREGQGFLLKEPGFLGGKPLYQLPALHKDLLNAAILVEGEWCADKLSELGVLATTSGNSQSAAAADWSHLAGRVIYIWPDNDPSGLTYAEETAAKLLALGCRVRVLDPETIGLGDKEDAVDWLAAHPEATADEIWNLTTGFHKRSGQVELDALAELGFTKSEEEQDSSEIGLILPPGVAAINIFNDKGESELQSVLGKHDSLGKHLLIITPSQKYLVFHLEPWQQVTVASNFAPGLAVLLAGTQFLLPASGLWSVKFSEMDNFPTGILHCWPSIFNGPPTVPLSFDEQCARLKKSAAAAKWPKPISGDALIGLAGEFVNIVSPETEGDLSALYVSFLTGVGAMFDSSTLFNVGSTPHFTVLFALIIGEFLAGDKLRALITNSVD